MDLSISLFIAASFAVLCTFYIGKSILTIDFSEYSSKNSKKAKLKRLLAKKDTPLSGSKIRRDIRKAFERILIPLGKADQKLLPARMDMAFRKKIVSQINRLNRNKLCRKIYITDVVPVPKNDFEAWNDDGREWRESVLMCSTLERFESTEDNKVQHEIYRKNSYLRILQSRHIRSADRKEKKKSYYSDMLKITCPSCGASVKLDSQQVTCEYCGAVIKNEFYDWQTESFELYESIGTNLKRFLQLLVSGSILFLCVFLCLYLIEDTEISLAAGVGAAVLAFGVIITPIIYGKVKQEKLAGKIVRYSENFLRACLNEYFWENENDEDLLDFSVGTIKLLKVNHAEETTTVTADIYGIKTFLPENQKPYTEKFKKRLILQRARYPEKRKADGEFFIEKDCPSCGANFMPDENNCCSFCGFGLQVNNAKWIVQKNN
jgi:ribosomal protein S27E